MKEGFPYVGRPLPVYNVKEKLTGAMKYTGDVELPHMLHGKILRSPYPHASILGIDTSGAERLLGRERFIATAKDGPDTLFGGAIYESPFLQRARCAMWASLWLLWRPQRRSLQRKR